MLKYFPLFFSLFLLGCGGSSGSDATSAPSPTPTPDPQPTLIMKPNSTIESGRKINVLFLLSNTNDQRKLTRDEVTKSFNVVKEILNYNGIDNSYNLNFDYYDTNLSTDDLRKIASEGDTPEGKVLASSDWIKDEANKNKINNSDVIILRTSFNEQRKGFWGAATNQLQGYKYLSKVAGVNGNINVLNSPIDPESDAYPYKHNVYLDDELKISRFDRILGHEFIHALGFHAHDNGVDTYADEELSEKLTKNIDYYKEIGSKTEYGDCFSIMGDSECSLMLSPSAREVLGVDFDTVSVYGSKKIKLQNNQILKVFLKRARIEDTSSDQITYLTISKPDLNKYGKSLNGDLEREGANHSLQGNMDGFLIRLVSTDIATESMPHVVLLDAFPPVNNYIYTLQEGHSITMGDVVKVEFLSQEGKLSNFKISYL